MRRQLGLSGKYAARAICLGRIVVGSIGLEAHVALGSLAAYLTICTTYHQSLGNITLKPLAINAISCTIGHRPKQVLNTDKGVVVVGHQHTLTLPHIHQLGLRVAVAAQGQKTYGTIALPR